MFLFLKIPFIVGKFYRQNNNSRVLLFGLIIIGLWGVV